MKKQILISLLISSSAFAYGMEDDIWRWFSSWRSYLPTCFSSTQKLNESQLISDLRAKRNIFEGKFAYNQWIYPLEEYSIALHPFSVDEIDTMPTQFLHYCYYQKFHTILGMTLNHLDTSASLLIKCQNAQTNGYSCLGATMIAKDMLTEEKRDFIDELLKRNFKPTPEDIQLTKLILYDGITTHQTTILHLRHAHSQADWSVLPPEIRKLIALYMIELFKSELWLLPEKSLSDL